MSDAFLVQVDLCRQTEFEHDLLIVRQLVEFFQQVAFQDIFGCFLILTFNVYLVFVCV